MSHDLAFFAHVDGLTEEQIRSAYRAYCEGTTADSGVASSILTAFVERLESRYPQLSDLNEEELDSSPWSAEFDRGPTHLIICMAFSRAVDVGQYILDLLQSHPLIVYDPQADQAFFGPQRLPLARPVAPRQSWKFWK